MSGYSGRAELCQADVIRTSCNSGVRGIAPVHVEPAPAHDRFAGSAKGSARLQGNANCSLVRDTRETPWRDSMADKNTLHDAFLDELRDMYHAEKQLTNALPKLAKKAKNPDLSEAFQSHLAETENHVTRLEQVFAELGETPKTKTCDGMKAIIDEANEMIGESYDDQTMDAVLIASAQRAEHYEIAAYGTLVTWARTMEHDT